MRKNFIAAFVILLIFAVLVIPFILNRSTIPTQVLSQAEFVQMLQFNLIAKLELRYPAADKASNEVRGTFYPKAATGNPLVEEGKPVEIPFRASIQLTDALLERLMQNSNFTTVTARW